MDHRARFRIRLAVTAALPSLVAVLFGVVGPSVAGVVLPADLSPVSVDPSSDRDGAGAEPAGTSPSYVVAQDTAVDGSSYTLSAYQSNEGLCLDLAATGARGTGGGCGFDTQGDAVSYVVTSLVAGAATYVYGPVWDSVATVTVQAGSGLPVTARTVENPAGLDFAGRFYVVRLPGSDLESIVVNGLDEAGGLVGSAVVPRPTEIQTVQ